MKQNTPPLVLRSEMRTDSVPVDEHYSAEGYFYDNPILTRTGIFKYTLEDGSERRELRRPEDVFDPESLASYEGKPIIITHDAQVIDKDNAHRERVGTILTPGQQDGETVRAKIVIDDPDAVKASGLRELSVGYYQDLIMEPGEWNGEPYDAIQTHIRVNHLALVAVARAGDDARLNMDSQDSNGGMTPMDENEKMNNPTQDDDATVDTTKPTTDDGEGAGSPPVTPGLDPVGVQAAIKAYLTATTGGATADDENNPAAGGDPTKPTEDDGEDDPTKPDALAEITARRDAMEDGQAKADINTLLSMLDAANARADAAEDDTKPTEDEDDNPDGSNSQLNHDSASAIAAQVSQRVELCRLGDKLHLDGMETMPVMQAKKKVVHAVIPGMRLDGKSSAYINAAFDIAKEKINGRKSVADQRRQIFNADSANAAVRDAGKKNDPAAARSRMIQRHAAEKED
ncbi:MAG: DUF2213 domain-containing protein [Faecalibacterium prausnitzii]